MEAELEAIATTMMIIISAYSIPVIKLSTLCAFSHLNSGQSCEETIIIPILPMRKRNLRKEKSMSKFT